MKKILVLLSLFSFVISVWASVTVSALKTDGKVNPEGIDNRKPVFRWQLSADKNDLLQKGYEIQVSDNLVNLIKGKKLLWQTKVKNSRSQMAAYAGEVALLSGHTYFWRVRVFTNQGKSEWSKPASWSMGLLEEAEWQASWIGLPQMRDGETDKNKTRLAARYLRKEFRADKPVKRAFLYICGLGLYEASLNGEKVGHDEMAPTVSLYSSRVYYNTYDVTTMIEQGNNALGVLLGNGRYFRMRDMQPTFGLPRLRCRLQVEYVDGTSMAVVSDGSWMLSDRGPIRENNEFDGEKYDARMELAGWNRVGYDATGWQPAEVMDAPGGSMTAQPNPNITVMQELHPLSVTKRDDGRYMVDMGQNMVGRLRIKVVGSKDVPVKMVFAETLKADGNLYLDNIRAAEVTDVYIPAADGEFVWEPKFVYHGFRYVLIEGVQQPPLTAGLTGCVLYDRMDATGTFECSDDLINRIYKNACWGIKGNYRGMPTDCPQRDERQGWLGDRATGCFGEAFAFDNEQLYLKWMQDIEDSQSEEGSISDVSPRYWTLWNDDVTWPSAYFLAAAMLERQYGNSEGIVRHYASMKKWMEHMEKTAMQDYIIVKDTYGDWCMPPERADLIHSEAAERKTDGRILSTTVYYSLLNMMKHFAVVAGEPDDTTQYALTAAKMREAYNKMFYHAEKGEYGNGTVTGGVLSLRLGLVPEGDEKKVFDAVVRKTEKEFDNHISVGVLGIQHIMRALTEYGRGDLACTLATNTSYPSWGYMIENGATTIWELWNGNTANPAMNSGNHVMLLGDLLIWMYENLAGIRCADDATGMQHLFMSPCLDTELTKVNASYETVQGKVVSEWEKKDGSFVWHITLPGNTTATLSVPERLGLMLPEQKGVHGVKVTADRMTEIEIGSGSYTFK